MKKIEFLINEPDVFEKKMKSVIDLLGKKDAKLLYNEFKKLKPFEIIYEMISNASILYDFCILTNKERRSLLLKYSPSERKYIIFNSWIFLRYMKYVSIEFGTQDNYAKECKLENQPSAERIFSFYSSSFGALNKLIVDFYFPFSKGITEA